MSGRLIVLSNRIPTEAEPAGGLVVALHECLTEVGGLWIGSSGAPVPEDAASDTLSPLPAKAYRKLAFDLTEAEHEAFYLGYSNSVLWPHFHRRADLMDVQDGFAEGYLAVNARVAGMIAAELAPDDLVWVHDYHFLPMAAELRKLGFGGRIGFFLHIPFPNPSDVPALPRHEDLPDWIAAYDLFGLQTGRDVANCRATLRSMADAELLSDDVMRIEGRRTVVRHFPIGIDAKAFAEDAARSDAGDRLVLRPGVRLVLGIDRLDYTKGLVQRFEAYGEYLARRNGEDPRATFLQVAPPTRGDVEAYQDIRTELEHMAGSVNGAHGDLDWTPIRYVRRFFPRDVLAGVYSRADVMMVTALADGMNLVAKEFVAAQNPDDPGVLILSHFAGAAEQMPEALMVNPYDIGETAETIRTALTMPLEERRERHAPLRRSVFEEDIGWWSENYLEALRDSRLY